MKKFLTTLMLILAVVVWSRGSPTTNTANSLTITAGFDNTLVAINSHIEPVFIDSYLFSFTDNSITRISINVGKVITQPAGTISDLKYDYKTNECSNPSPATLGGAEVKKILTDC